VGRDQDSSCWFKNLRALANIAGDICWGGAYGVAQNACRRAAAESLQQPLLAGERRIERRLHRVHFTLQRFDVKGAARLAAGE